MKIYVVTFQVDIEADNYDEAVREAKAAISDRDFGPSHVEFLDPANLLAEWQEVQ